MPTIYKDLLNELLYLTGVNMSVIDESMREACTGNDLVLIERIDQILTESA